MTWLALPDTDGSSLDGVLLQRQLVVPNSMALPCFEQRGLTFPHEGQLYRACWVISIFLTLHQSAQSPSLLLHKARTYVFRREAPYRVPYFPVTPTFFVRLVWFGQSYILGMWENCSKAAAQPSDDHRRRVGRYRVSRQIRWALMMDSS